jgi:diguanylate cyclase (GGDEF)-like protein
MGNKITKSLSTKIVLSISIVSVAIILIIFTTFEKINKKAFYNVEIEKANLIAETIEPLLALDIYLELDGKIDQLALQLIENPNILAVRIKKDDTIINDMRSPEFDAASMDSFVVTQTIHQPNSTKKTGELELVYSSKHYKELTEKYSKLTLYLALFLGVIFMLFSLFVRTLLSPLKKIAASLKDYSPDKTLSIPFSKEENEIGLISGALNEMQSKISEYANKQKNINLFLEEQVEKKTRELRKQLYTDALTSLPNRAHLVEELIGLDEGALIIVNIDDFKEINDFYGHIAGDQVLIKFAKRLQSLIKDDHRIKLNRLSGDEFALLYTHNIHTAAFEHFANRLLQTIENMIFYHEENELGIRVTLGGTMIMHQALEKADIALKSARKCGLSFMLYDEKRNIEEQYKANMEWVKKLKKSLDQDRIVPFFQPIFDNVTKKITSYECLIRIIEHNGDILLPEQFMQIAKKSRLSSKLTKIMIEKSCSHFEEIDCNFSINLSVDDMLNHDIVQFIKTKVTQHNVAGKIIFEILESEGIEQYQEVSGFIDEMKQLGCRIAIDDFGSGYSNFEHLLKLNIDYIKIDGTLIKDLDTDLNAQIVIETIVNFASTLKIKTIAEFVHSAEIYEKVKALGIDRSQGFHLGRPEATTCQDKKQQEPKAFSTV